MPTVIATELGNRWTAWLESNPETGFGGDTPGVAVSRLLETLPAFDVSNLVADNLRTTDGRLVFLIGEPCPDCGGSGEYVGLTAREACERCGGSGRVRNAFR